MEYTRICDCGCGEHPVLMVMPYYGTYSYCCTYCGMVTEEFIKKEDAVEAWNRKEVRECVKLPW